MNVNTLKNSYWLFRPFTWLSMFVGAAVLVGYIAWVFTMLKYSMGQP